MIRRILILVFALALFCAGGPRAGFSAQVPQVAPPGESPPPAGPSAGDVWTEPVTGMAFRWVPGGCFAMGSPGDEPGRNLDEGPVHEVCLEGFWMGETEVTQAQWQAITGKNPSLIHNGDDYPVDMVSWEMAKQFEQMISKRTGLDLRLPTEAQWEFACRAGASTPYAFGAELTHDQASFEKPFSLPQSSPAPRRRSKRSRKKPARHPAPRIWPNMHTSAVGSFPPNALGLRDMHGNVWEWCEDVYDAGYYARSARQDPLSDGEGASRVLRGGAWVTKVEMLRCANRSRAWPDLRTAFYGLRLVRPVPAVAPTAPATAGVQPAAMSNSTASAPSEQTTNSTAPAAPAAMAAPATNSTIPASQESATGR